MEVVVVAEVLVGTRLNSLRNPGASAPDISPPLFSLSLVDQRGSCRGWMEIVKKGNFKVSNSNDESMSGQSAGFGSERLGAWLSGCRAFRRPAIDKRYSMGPSVSHAWGLVLYYVGKYLLRNPF